jgi:hypothetical protein
MRKGSGSGSGQPLPRMMHVHRDPAMPPPYLNIHDPLHDSSGDQGDVDSGDDVFPRPTYRPRKQQRRFETPL